MHNEVLMMRRLLICSALVLAACSNDPVGKTPNGSPNNENNENNSNNGSNNTTPNSTTSNNCLNSSILLECPEYFTLVDECPAGKTCETVDLSCGVQALCLREIDPVMYRDTACVNDPDCDETAFGCAVDEDCALVKAGDYCGCLECPASAIENVNREAYVSYQEGARTTCDSLEPCGDAPCIEYLAHCNPETSQCEGRQSKYVTTTGLDDGCEVAADCAPIFEGEVCDACMCPNEAIPANLVETYQSAFDVECAHGVACDCAPYEVRCNEGTCELGEPG